jgi:hypothetical protein
MAENELVEPSTKMNFMVRMKDTASSARGPSAFAAATKRRPRLTRQISVRKTPFPMRLKLLALLLGLFFVPAAVAQSAFPGLKSVLTAAEWERAGLDRLSPDQVGVIDAALIRHYYRALANVTPSVAAEVEAKKQQVARFGFDKIEGDWREAPALVQKVVGWQGPNRFVLDNGQVWEGLEPIRFEIVDKEVTISARPNNSYSVSLDGKSNGARVRRTK